MAVISTTLDKVERRLSFEGSVDIELQYLSRLLSLQITLSEAITLQVVNRLQFITHLLKTNKIKA
jgi:hypothetical protein